MTAKVVLLLVLVSIEIEEMHKPSIYMFVDQDTCNMQFDFERSEGCVDVYIMIPMNLCRLATTMATNERQCNNFYTNKYSSGNFSSIA